MTAHRSLGRVVGRLLDNGAVLDLTNPHGPTSSWPLARHHLIEDGALWIRPLIGGHRTDTGVAVFPLGDCLRRGIALDSYTITGTGIRFALGSAQVVELRAASTSGELEALQLWDSFTLTVLTADEEADLDRLDADSWHGRYT